MSGATSVTEDDNKETIKDDVSDEIVNKVDDSKLAALKAKSKEKKNEGNVSAKIVANKSRSVNLGVIGSGQAGCISGKTNIILSDRGIDNIENLFNATLESENISNVEVLGNGDICIKLTNDVYTPSINPETGKIEKKRVNAVWKLKKKSKNKITTESGTSLTCSKTHPSLVFNPLNRRRAYFKSLSDSIPLSIGDKMVDTRGHVVDCVSNKTFVRGIEITENIAWLLGLFAGDGSTKSTGNEISFYLSDSGTLNKANKLLTELFSRNSISLSEKNNCTKLSLSGLQSRLFFETAFDIFNGKTYGGSGSKTFTVTVPKCISSSYSNIRAAFISGLIDSDGTVCKEWCESSISTVSNDLADQVGCLLSSIGSRSTVENTNPKNENESAGFRIRLSGKINHGPLMSNIVKNMAHPIKKETLLGWLNSEQQSFSTSLANLSFNELEYWMKSEGKMKSVNDLSNLSKVSLGNWSRGERQLSLPSLHKVLASLEGSEQLSYVDEISNKLDLINSIESSDECEVFYDLTVADYENYLAGNNGFIFTHNSRLAESFYKMGYGAVVVNTALQDLKHIDVPDSNKLLLDNGVGGASRELDIGEAAAYNHQAEFSDLVANKLGDVDVNMLCISLGGGSGAGSVEPLVDVLSNTGKPLVCLCVLPMASEDVACKSNSLQTLSKLAKMAQDNVIANLMVVDNARIETIFSDVGTMNFFAEANKAITEPIDVLNTLSAEPSPMKPLDSMEFSKLFLDSGGLTSYGSFTVENYEDDTAIAEAVVNNLNNNLLASGLNLSEAKHIGFVVVANEKVWSKIPATSIQYAKHMVNDIADNPQSVFDGQYVIDCEEDVVKVYSIFNGMGLPRSRIDELKEEVKVLTDKVSKRDADRKGSLDVGLANDTVSAADKIKQKIKNKGSVFGKFAAGKVVKPGVRDRRGN